MATKEPTPKIQAGNKPDDEIEIPFVNDEDIATGQEERIKLFAAIAAKEQAVPKAWLVSQLSVAEASLASLTSRYGYSLKTVQTKSGSKAVKLSVKKDTEKKQK